MTLAGHRRADVQVGRGDGQVGLYAGTVGGTDRLHRGCPGGALWAHTAPGATRARRPHGMERQQDGTE